LKKLAVVIAVLVSWVRTGQADTVLPGLIQERLVIPITLPDSKSVKLEGLLVRPDRVGPFPLVILVHGSPRSEPGKFLEAYAKVSPTVLANAALAFAQRGFAAVSILRRGFGRSEGPYAEFIGDACANTDYLKPARTSAEDVLGAVAALRKEPWVDPQRVLMLGHSTGGLAVIAAGAANPQGVIGILNFAGGRGSFRPDEVCSPDRLVEAFASFGHSARIPALWIFAENDHYLGLSLESRLFDAYSNAGAPAQFDLLPPFGADGHLLVSAGPSELWWPSAEKFLGDLHLPTAMVVPLPPMTALRPPVPLNEACTTFFNHYNAVRTDAKAFAIGPEGHCSSSTTARTVDEAKEEALSRCVGAWKQCSLYAVGQSLVRG
jgi:dienelactone hydrolase